MKIDILTLNNITRHKMLTFQPDSKINVIVGANAAGKTTIKDAIAYALTGRCDRTDKGGKGATDMIRAGEKSGSIYLAAADLFLTRNINGKGNTLDIEGHQGTAATLQGLIDSALGVDNKVVTAALSSSEFLDMSPKDQVAGIFDLAGITLDSQAILELITNEAPIEHKLDVGRELDGVHFTSWPNLHKHVYDCRRDIKRRLQELGRPHGDLSTEHQPKEVVEATLRELKAEVHDKRNKLTAIRTTSGTRESLKADTVELREQLDQIPEPGGKTKKPETLQAQRETTEADLSKHSETLAAVSLEIETALKAIANLKDTEEERTCPLGEGIKCALGKERRRQIVVSLEEQITVRKKEVASAKEKIGELNDTWLDLGKKVSDAAGRGRITAAIERATKTLESLPEADEDPGELEGEIIELNKRIEKGEAILAEIHKEEGYRQAVEEQAKEKEQLEDRVKVYEWLVDITSPSGLPARILSEKIGPIESRANERLQKLTDGRYGLKLEVEPEFGIKICHDGAETDLRALSSSERLRVGIILQDALVSLSGLRFLLIDNADILDPQNRALLIDLLLDIQDYHDQIIVLSTTGPAGVINPGIPGLTVYSLNGTLEVVE